jgi:hypothetical protein
MKTEIVVVIVSMSLVCAACNEDKVVKKHVVSIVADKALVFAETDDVDIDQYSLQSVQLLRDGQMGTIDDSENDEYISSIRKNLKGKKYWEACYMVTADMVLGAKYCYYFEDPKLNHLTTYRVK